MEAEQGLDITPPGTLEEIAVDPHQPRIMCLADLIDEWDDRAGALYNAKIKGLPIGPVSGFAEIDLEMCGAFQPGVHIIHGDPGAGKTAFVLQIACTCGCPALYVTCEMGPLELLRRITARVTETFLGRFKTGELPPEKAGELVRRAIDSLPNLFLADATRAPARMAWIAERAMEIRSRVDAPHLLVIIDSVHAWADAAFPEAQTEYEAVNSGLAAMRWLGSACDIPVIGVAERNRISQGKGGMNASASSRKFEYAPETVLELARNDAEAEPDSFGDMPITLRFAKNRHGTPGRTVRLLFNGALQSFREA